MKLFVLGHAGAGKTPLARLLSARLGVAHVAASAWVRRVFPDATADRDAMARFSIERLRDDPRACLDTLALDGDCVVEGMRNPFDFVHAFDWRRDRVIFVDRKDNTAAAPTEFERGVDVIRAYVAWAERAGLLDAGRARDIVLASAADIERAVDEVAAWIGAVPQAVSGKRSRVHADIAPLDLFVDKPVLYGNDARFDGEIVPCKAFAFSSYPGSAPTFEILLGDGAVFSYVAPSVLRWREDVVEPKLALADLVYLNCPAADFVVHASDALAGDVLCFFKHRELWLRGRYRFTVDWYEGNDLLHCIFVENGQIAFLPHHKVKFHDDAIGFQPYKKLRNEWRV